MGLLLLLLLLLFGGFDPIEFVSRERVAKNHICGLSSHP